MAPIAASPSELPRSFEIQARDGRVYEFAVEPGQIGGDRPTKFGGAFKAAHRHADGTESSFYWNEGETDCQIASISLRPEMRNSGVGLELYKRVADRALSQGKTFSSDSTVSSEALKIYPKLAALGYPVSYAPHEEVAVWDHQPRDEADLSRPSGSQQFMGRGERPIAVVGAKGVGEPASEPPLYLKALLAKKAGPALATIQPPPLPPPLPPEIAAPAAAGRDWLVAIDQQPVRKTHREMREMIALDRVDGSTLARPAEAGAMWAPAGFQPELLSMIQAARAPRWSVAREEPGSEGAQKAFGPYSDQQVCAYAAQGRIKSSDLAWTGGMESWAPMEGTEAGALARLGRDNAQAFFPAVDIAGSLMARREPGAVSPAAPKARAPG